MGFVISIVEENKRIPSLLVLVEGSLICHPHPHPGTPVAS
jgi:hypothetical protein